MATLLYKNSILVFFIGFIINLMWEIAHSPLYDCFDTLQEHLPMILRASFGDAFYILTLYLIFAFILRDVNWFRRLNKGHYLLIGLIGLAAAVFLEGYALATNRWSYKDIMSLAPIVNVGLTPFIQLAILSIITLRILKSYN